MVFGMIEFGRVIMVQQVLTNGVREGARYAVLDGSTSALAKQKVADYLSSAGVSGATVSVRNSSGAEVEPSTIGYGESVIVNVQIPFSSVGWLPTPWFLSNSTQLKAVAVMRRETVQ
jgi:Flp pilus assembly protein TadG